MPLALAPDQLNDLLKLLTTPGLVLADIATRLKLSLLDLADWLLLPETERLLARLEQAARRHAHLLSAAALPTTIAALDQHVQDDLRAASAPPSDEPKARALRARERDQSRKAINLLIKLARPDLFRQPRAVPAETDPDDAPAFSDSDVDALIAQARAASTPSHAGADHAHRADRSPPAAVTAA